MRTQARTRMGRPAQGRRRPPAPAPTGPPAAFAAIESPAVRQREHAAFTLIELLVVISIISLLIAIMAPGVQRAMELARRARCAANLHSLSVGLATYAGAHDGKYPWLLADATWNAATGQNYSTPPGTTVARNVSALLFLLVRDGQAPGLFLCPSTDDRADPNTRTADRLNWDFSPHAADLTEHVSYSYQAPLNTGASAQAAYASGVGEASDGGLVIAADRTPAYDGKTPNYPWTARTGDPKDGMSQNHTRGEYINVLYAGGHVGNGTRADLGVANDNIYSSAAGAVLTEQGAGTLNLPDHDSPTDSFLLGPKRHGP